MKSYLLLLFLLFSGNSFFCQYWNQIDDELGGYGSAGWFGNSVALNDAGNIVVIGGPYHGNHKGVVQVYELYNNHWFQKGEDLNGFENYDYLGSKVSIDSSGNTIAFSSPYNDEASSTAGKVAVFVWKNGGWLQKGQSLFGEMEGGHFGSTISLSDDGNTLVVSAVYHPDGVAIGMVKVYQYIDNAWIQKGSTLNGYQGTSFFGRSIVMNSDATKLVISAPVEGWIDVCAGPGKVRTYEWNEEDWDQIGNIMEGIDSGENYGESLSMSSDGTILAVGSLNGNENTGYVKTFEWTDEGWSKIGSTIYGINFSDYTGACVRLNSSGTRLAIASPQKRLWGIYKGYVKIYDWNDSDWDEIGSINAEELNDSFGRSIDLNTSGNILAIGAPDNDDYGNNSGQVRVFENSDVLNLDDFSSHKKVNLFPNPAKEMLSLTFNETDGYSYEIINSLGKIVKSGQQISSSISIDQLPSGCYILTIIVKKEYIRLPFIKN